MLPPSSVSKNKPSKKLAWKQVASRALCWFLAWLILQPWRWRWNIPPGHWSTLEDYTVLHPTTQDSMPLCYYKSIYTEVMIIYLRSELMKNKESHFIFVLYTIPIKVADECYQSSLYMRGLAQIRGWLSYSFLWSSSVPPENAETASSNMS
jgi:hypothetical protein